MIDFTQIVTHHGGGNLMIELNETTTKLIKDCLDTQKKGKIGITFLVEPVQSRDGHQVKLTPTITANNPRYDSGVQFMFVVMDKDTNEPTALETDNPAQMNILDQLNGLNKAEKES